MTTQRPDLMPVIRPGAGSEALTAVTDRNRQAPPFNAELFMAQRMLSTDGETQSMSYDMNYTTNTMMVKALETLAQLNLLGATGGAVSPDSPEAAAMAVRMRRSAGKPGDADGLGSVSARFESGDKGSEAIGWDRTGGTSYGKYQLAAKVGTMDKFIDFLRVKAPDLARRLDGAGPADTGSTRGGMPDEWRKIAAENPTRLEKLEHEFIKNTHYLPARDKILEATGVDVDRLPPALREALWSTSVQHGPSGAASIFSAGLENLEGMPGGAVAVKKLIGEVYDRRKTQFGSSTAAVREAVKNRLSREQTQLLAMLGRGVNEVA